MVFTAHAQNTYYVETTTWKIYTHENSFWEKELKNIYIYQKKKKKKT